MAANSGNGPLALPLATPLAVRPISINGAPAFDSYVINGIVEREVGGQTRLYKRPSVYGAVNTSHGAGNGLFGSYSVEGSNLYVNGVLVGAVAAGSYWFEQTLGTPSYIYLSNGTSGYTVSSGGAFAAIADPVYTGTIGVTVRGAAYLDGTLYIMDAKGQIWGSKNLNDPTTWDALNMIRAQIEPDAGVAIAKQKIYVVAMKQWTTEFFYDAGNPTGSPLLPVQNAKLSYGCALATTVVSQDDILFFQGQNRAGESFFVRVENLQAKIISNPEVMRLVSSFSPVSLTVSSWCARVDNHLLYGLRYYSAATGVDYTLVYDNDSGLWYLWKFGAGGVPFSRSTGGSAGVPTTFQDAVTGNQYYLSGYAGDVTALGGTATPAQLEVLIPSFDGGTRVEKVLTRLLLQVDQASAGSVEICWSDDDYQTWSPWRLINVTDPLPQLNDLGSFRKRAFKLRHSSATFIRFLAIEIDALLGSF